MKPSSQAHVSGFVQFPCTHAGWHTGTAHRGPLQPVAQVHVLGPVQEPCGPQPPDVFPLHDGSSQVAPPQPLSQVHVSGAVHLPWDEQGVVQMGVLQPAPS